MPNDVTPYLPRNPGDLLSAGDWNQVQVDIKSDISAQITKAVGGIESVPHANDADKLGGKSVEDLIKDIIQKVLEVTRSQSGTYQRIFKRLELCKEQVINHGLKASPLIDVYQLDYFPAVCARGEEDQDDTPVWVNFYLYHLTERRIRVSGGAGNPNIVIDIEPADTQVARIKFSDLLTLYGVTYIDTTDLEEIEASFWAKFLPNDEFEADQYCHSPWFEKCCGERRTVAQLKERQDWDRIYLKWMPRKTINLLSSNQGISLKTLSVDLSTASSCSNTFHPTSITAAPTQIQVIQYDLDTIGIKLVDTPVYPDEQVKGLNDQNGARIKLPDGSLIALPQDFLKQIKVMLLLKV